ncbi:uncharacterized protein LOC130726432 isoform X2 [Lotus japonicus]|uniref:uncharacterized protein LOC130726432 isoform X2 n=1 Tax=Lotus japonicus TaxID=34305 RepID=UPI0025905337|nr:uncharacterized protein LOC130726432 isoform X2 [Lotus japonicus]
MFPFLFEHHVTDKIVICCYVWNWLLTETNSRRPDSSCSWRISLLGGLCPRVWIGRNGQHSQHTNVMLRKLKNIPSRVPLLQKKRKAAEKEAALIHEENAQANGTFDSKTQVGNCTDSSIVMKSKANEQVGEEDAVVDCADTNQYNEFDPVDVHKDVSHPCVDSNLHVESCMLVDPVEVHKNITILEEEKKPEPGIAGEEVLAFPVEGGAVNSSPKLSTNSKASKLSHPLDERKASAAVPLPPRNGINCVSKSKKRVGVRDTVEKKRLTAGSLHMSIDLPSGTHESSKTASAALQSRNGLNRFSTSKKSVGGSLEKKRIITPSLSKSINLSSGTGVSSKTASC